MGKVKFQLDNYVQCIFYDYVSQAHAWGKIFEFVQ